MAFNSTTTARRFVHRGQFRAHVPQPYTTRALLHSFATRRTNVNTAPGPTEYTSPLVAGKPRAKTSTKPSLGLAPIKAVAPKSAAESTTRDAVTPSPSPRAVEVTMSSSEKTVLKPAAAQPLITAPALATKQAVGAAADSSTPAPAVSETAPSAKPSAPRSAVKAGPKKSKYSPPTRKRVAVKGSAPKVAPALSTVPDKSPSDTSNFNGSEVKVPVSNEERSSSPVHTAAIEAPSPDPARATVKGDPAFERIRDKDGVQHEATDEDKSTETQNSRDTAVASGVKDGPEVCAPTSSEADTADPGEPSTPKSPAQVNEISAFSAVPLKGHLTASDTLFLEIKQSALVDIDSTAVSSSGDTEARLIAPGMDERGTNHLTSRSTGHPAPDKLAVQPLHPSGDLSEDELISPAMDTEHAAVNTNESEGSTTTTLPHLPPRPAKDATDWPRKSPARANAGLDDTLTSPAKPTYTTLPRPYTLPKQRPSVASIRQRLNRAGFAADFPKASPSLGVHPDWDRLYYSCWPFLKVIDAGQLSLKKEWLPPFYRFDHTKLPPLIPLDDKYWQAAFGGNLGITRLSALGGDAAIYLGLYFGWTEHSRTSTEMSMIRHHLVANQTLAFLAIHYGLTTPKYLSDRCPSYSGSKIAGTVFEAWIGAACLQYSERNEMSVLFAWLADVFDLRKWPDANDAFWAARGGQRPDMLRFGE